MRELKFRVYDIQNERMVNDPYRFETALPSEREAAPWIFYEDWQDIDDGIRRACHVMQYTGLKDKNGVEIYEGDIIEWSYEYDADYDGDMPIVKTSAGRYAITDIFDRTRIVTAANESKGCWVIGNIYQNPELLNP